MPEAQQPDYLQRDRPQLGDPDHIVRQIVGASASFYCGVPKSKIRQMLGVWATEGEK